MEPITETQRLRLHETLRRAHGDEVAAMLMKMVPPTGSAGVATKEDVAALREDFDRFRTEIRAEIRRDIEPLATREEMYKALHAQTRTYITWTLTANATLTTIVGLLVGLLAILS